MSTQQTELENNTFNNDQISVVVTRQPYCQVKMDITVTPEAAEAAYHKAFKSVTKEVTIPGFRKGKAPTQLIKENYSQPIQKEWIDVVLNTGFNEALQLSQLHPYRNGHMKRPVVHECSREKGARFTIEFEAQPTVPTIDMSSLELKKIEPAVVTDEHAEQTLRQIRLQFMDYEPVTERGIQDGDFVDLDLDILEPNPRRVTNHTRVEVNEQGLPSWIREKVIGLKAGETAEGKTEQDPNNPQENFESVSFRVTIHAIWNGKLPEVDDELAKKVGLQSVDELKEKIRERLTHEAEEDARSQLQKNLEEQLIEKYPIDLPKSLIEEDKKARLEDYLKRVKEEQGENATRSVLPQVRSAIEAGTIYSLTLFFLMRKLAAENQIDVTDQEIAQELNTQLSLLSSGRSNIDITGDREGLREQVRTLALNKKIREFLLAHAKIEE